MYFDTNSHALSTLLEYIVIVYSVWVVHFK